MAGDPTFDRAKQFYHKHTNHRTRFKGSQTVHTKANLNASVDGNVSNIVAGNVTETIAGNLTVNVAKSNQIRSKKISKSIADITAASIEEAIHLFDVAAGDSIHDVVAYVATPFRFGNATLGIASLIKVEVGDGTDRNALALQHLCGSSTSGWIMDGQTGLTDKGVYLWNASVARVPKVFTSAASIFAKFTSSGDTVLVSSLDQGNIDFHVDILSRI